MTVVLTLVQTKQIIHINETIKNRVQTIQNTANTSTHMKAEITTAVENISIATQADIVGNVNYF